MLRCTLALLLALLPLPALAAGTVLEGLAAPSAALGRDLRYSVYLPGGHGAGPARFPVLLALHGFGASPAEWTGNGLPETLDRMIAAGEIDPMIVVMPDAGRSWYVDSAALGGPGDVETAIVRDLLAAVDRRYATAAGTRAVAGNSMGGYGALRFAFGHPERFVAVAALSPALFWEGTTSRGKGPAGMTDADRRRWYPGTFGTPFDMEIHRARSPFAQVDAVAGLARPPAILLLSGDDDYFDLQEGTVRLYLDLREAGLAPELRIGDGGHDWDYWRGVLPEVLRFVDAAFKAEMPRR